VIPQPAEQPATISLTMDLSSREAVQALGFKVLQLIFDGDGYEEMVGASGMTAFMARAAKPVMRRKAEQSIQNMSEDQARWFIDQVHQLSRGFENATGNYSPYHYDLDE
jgi:hypothetical protein